MSVKPLRLIGAFLLMGMFDCQSLDDWLFRTLSLLRYYLCYIKLENNVKPLTRRGAWVKVFLLIFYQAKIF